MNTASTQSSNQYQNDVKHHKKTRQGRRNEIQLSFLVDYMVQHPHMATGKLKSHYKKDNLNGSWDELVVQLNNLRNPSVKEKDVKSWKDSWRCLKTTVFKKAFALRNAKILIANKPIIIPELNDREKKVLSLMSFEHVEGTLYPDSFLKDQCDNVEHLAVGNHSIIDAEPTSITIKSFDVDSDLLSKKNLNKVCNENVDTREEIEEHTYIATLDSAEIPAYKFEQPASTSEINSRKRKLFQNQNNLAKKNLKTQLVDTQDMFTKLAETNAHLNNLSQSISQLVSTMSRIAENDNRRLRNEENMLAFMQQLVEKIRK